MPFRFNGFGSRSSAPPEEARLKCPACGVPVYATGRGTLLCARCGLESVIVILPSPDIFDGLGNFAPPERPKPKGPQRPSRILVDVSIRNQRWSAERTSWPKAGDTRGAPGSRTSKAPASPPPRGAKPRPATLDLRPPKTAAEAREILGVAVGATKIEIRAKRKLLARELHSDLGHGAAAAEHLKIVNAAADLLLRVLN